ncbi:MAG: zinc ribbon domain-containing protein [Anaerovibrio sp.]|uniref:zinc ribbon domain-containing protein n=1 Tax=Anaerovibrio sp. TaxID=1872532 RepID=UPI0025DEAE76|nr:zinc ribbon domain-containing protein [Anaerovibrio sp.]MCR5175760.1 zinc ribbon domain-containing protein [Anaerovibrio sp.]
MSKFCTGCGKELADDEKFCTQCGMQQNDDGAPNTAPMQPQNMPVDDSKDKRKKKIIIAVGVVVVFLLGCLLFAGGGDNGSKSKGGSAIAVKSEEMLNDYIRDQGTAESKYKNKKVSITGQVQHKSQFNNSNDFNLTLELKQAAGRTYAIAIDVPADKVEIVNKAEEGKFISVEGKCVGVVPQDDPTKISIQIQADKVNQ